MDWSLPLGSDVPTVTGRDMLVMSTVGFPVPSLTLVQGWKASGVDRMEMNWGQPREKIGCLGKQHPAGISSTFLQQSASQSTSRERPCPGTSMVRMSSPSWLAK